MVMTLRENNLGMPTFNIRIDVAGHRFILPLEAGIRQQSSKAGA